MELLKHEN